jgi:hypothetical protein
MSYGIIFWENSADSKNVFYIQKKIIRIMWQALKGEPHVGNCLKNLIFH